MNKPNDRESQPALSEKQHEKVDDVVDDVTLHLRRELELLRGAKKTLTPKRVAEIAAEHLTGDSVLDDAIMQRVCEQALLLGVKLPRRKAA